MLSVLVPILSTVCGEEISLKPTEPAGRLLPVLLLHFGAAVTLGLSWRASLASP